MIEESDEDNTTDNNVNAISDANTALALSRPEWIRARISFKPTSFVYPAGMGRDIGVDVFPASQLLLYAIALKQYAIENGYDTTYAFLSNMGMLTSKKRFFVINLTTMQVEMTGLVAQGRGLGESRFDKQYSNTRQSKCTSLGKYKILNKYFGEYGDSYRLAGLDTSNSNAFGRNIVLHAMGCLPDEEQPKLPVCVTEGCPGVSVNFLSGLSSIIDSRKKPLLLWIFDSNLEEIIVQAPSTEAASETADTENRPDHQCAIHRISREQEMLP
jgi:hypothetical protein